MIVEKRVVTKRPSDPPLRGYGSSAMFTHRNLTYKHSRATLKTDNRCNWMFLDLTRQEEHQERKRMCQQRTRSPVTHSPAGVMTSTHNSTASFYFPFQLCIVCFCCGRSFIDWVINRWWLRRVQLGHTVLNNSTSKQSIAVFDGRHSLFSLMPCDHAIVLNSFILCLYFILQDD